MYSYTRQQAADNLGVSTRSIDRYIKSGKLRSKKDGKIIYIHSGDIDAIIGKSTNTPPEVILTDQKLYQTSQSSSQVQAQSISPSSGASTIVLEKIYSDMRNEITQKDHAIQELSLQLGHAQEIAKNSISIVEYKKSQFLLEESKGHLAQEVTALKEENSQLEKKLQSEKSTNYLLIAFCVILVFGIAIIWFLKI